MSPTNLSATEISSPDTTQRIQSFREKFGEAHMYLAYHAAFPLALTPHLLYRLWANFQQDIKGEDLKIPWIAVADLLLSPLCNEVGRELYEIEPETRNVLLEQLNNNPRFNKNNHKRINTLAHFLLAYIQQQLNSPKNSVRSIAQAQRWTALAYLDPEAAAHDLALQLTKLSLDEKTEWVRMSKLAETLAAPFRAQFEPLLIYLQGMRYLARGNEQGAASKFNQLPINNNCIVVARVTLFIPEFEKSVGTINTVQVPDMTTKVIEIRNLWAGYGSEPILQNINLIVKELDFIGIISPNDGGKRTLLKVILGLVKPMKGEIKIMDRSVESGRKLIGYVPQSLEFERNFPVRVKEVVQMGRLGQRKLFQRYNSQDRAIVKEALERVEMWSMRHRRLDELSREQRQRVYIARALASNPSILILDEPTARGDSRISQSICKLLSELNQYITIILVSHNLAAIYSLVKTIVCINRRLVYHGNKQIPAELLEQTYKFPLHLIVSEGK